MKLRTRTSGIVFLSLFGVADSWYLAQHALTNTALSCGIGGALSGCNIVAQSAYSHVFGIPLAIYGIAFYATTALVAVAAPQLRNRLVYTVLAVLGVIGLLASMYFEAIQIFLIHALCVYCLASFFFSFAIFILTLSFWRNKSSEPMTVLPEEIYSEEEPQEARTAT